VYINFFMKRKFLSISLILFIFISYGQDSLYIKENAIKINRQDSLGREIYNIISGYKLIMVGENHGTNEPAEFVISLAYLLSKEGNKVQIGLEIPSDQMKKFLILPSDSNIYSSSFFSYKRLDSRASTAWVQLIQKFIDNKSVEVFFFDINSVNNRTVKDRDSLMYLNIKNRVLRHPSWKTITLSGNIHNMLLPYDGETKMGLYLLNDKDLNIANETLSIKHSYAGGEIWDNYGDNLKRYSVDNSNSIFAKSVKYENYLLIYPQDSKLNYSGIYFTRKVSVANLISEK
jgi:hypothetical protein